jgi:hypothetical protein
LDVSHGSSSRCFQKVGEECSGSHNAEQYYENTMGCAARERMPPVLRLFSAEVRAKSPGVMRDGISKVTGAGRYQQIGH